ncbi:HAMP domain-containing histidine kinase [Paenibacillus sp. sptzw28]|uniref:sensor histidine kinase n=1 Tax=Paenibacillus sp. sptzw28 TaxID=715179 RepID=UPI001C6E0876|nr:HAMP domain-containing sensor histidine kinase [Paenibacillus sp. sptzw28]QYR22729.1 HAMP domain-containing histidine kinase [Paenibacillus sp. sptzw28]
MSELTNLEAHMKSKDDSDPNDDQPPSPSTYIYWGSNGRFIKQIPAASLSSEQLRVLRNYNGHHSLETVHANGDTFRTLSAIGDTGTRLQVVYDLRTETKVLSEMLIIIWLLVAGSIGLSLIAGFFLAKKSLVPIQKSWDRQQQFIADASHELRTPLSVLQIHLERLFRHPGNTIEQESVNISVMIDETKRINKLVSELLLLARSDSNELQLMKQPLRLNTIINHVVQQFQIVAEMKGIFLRTTIDSDMEMMGDLERLHQLFVILLDNAVKFTKEGGVTVRSYRKGNEWRLVIEDSGIGIGITDLPRIFDRFFTVDKIRNRMAAGTGLGLSIAKWIVEAHEGIIEASSTLGSGTTIELRFRAA